MAVRTTARPDALTILARAGAAVAAAGPDTITISGLPPDRIVALLSQSAVPFSEVSAHRATLEEAYLELTRDAAEYRAAPPVEGGAAVTSVVAPYRSGQQAGRDGFPQLLWAEWTKFRTVQGWVAGLVAAALMVVLFAVLAGISSDQPGQTVRSDRAGR